MVKKIAILGGGESGVGAAVLAQKKGFEVFLSDKGKISNKYKKVLSQFEISYEEGKHSGALILNADEIIKSPGIPENVPIITKAFEKQIPVISEIEFAGRFTNAKTICITGSNGKTTTALLTYKMLKDAGLNVGLAGNIGKSFALQVALNDFDYFVLEISSFQLDGMFDFKADIAVLLNITPDHLDRYDNDFTKYAASKFRIIRNQLHDDAFIYCYDDPVITELLKKVDVPSGLYPFSIRQMDKNLAASLIEDKNQFLNSRMIININAKKMMIALHDMALTGKHNVYNSMAAAIGSRLLDIRKENIKQSLKEFQGVGHRLEYIATIRGIDFINDSKATNINSTWYALENADKPVIWIAGGQDKGNDYSSLVPMVKEKVKVIICLGLENTKIKDTFQEHVGGVIEVRSAEDAVKLSYQLGQKGDTVLLSPACASFDLFKNYEDRGNQFRTAVLNL
ncbi:MAG: UDP-N-acetylmuramoyl-L-alanine--D-glutamate ligase [Bacteroidetes bacterium 4484_276]|nr:MAG: UDP-N-acetylmuramoyl-L-alanine--D-glutamate ligase [Bacteroidetes bacterium 4484_276]OYT13335.1 MAG: UDP-N-acetylmuramoyl-L-alanine--D-glutamate ligase [Bacteroidetes bacterium 4572_114]